MEEIKTQINHFEVSHSECSNIGTEERRRRGLSCFTLIELVVSMSVLAVLMMIMMSFFSAAQQSWTASSAKSQVYDNARLAMDLISRDLQSAIYEKNVTPFWHRDKGSINERIYFISATSILPNDKCTSSNAEVVYGLGDGSNEGWLERSVTGNLDNSSADNPKWNYSKLAYPNNFKVGNTGIANVFTAGTTSTDSTDEFQKVIPYVTNLYFRCFKKDGTEIPPDTTGNKDTEFPNMVSINLTLMDRNSWLKWKAMGGDPTLIFWDHPSNTLKDSDPQSDYRKLHERKFTKMVFIGDRGQ